MPHADLVAVLAGVRLDITMSFADRPLGALSRQLGHPAGLAGRAVGRLLNRGNRSVVVAALEAAEVTTDTVVADIGFGGGVGLELLLRRVGVAGSVHGVEMSETMLSGARRRFADEIAAGRLQLHEGRMERLPLADASLDAIVTTNTIYFVDDLTAILRELNRVLRPNGRLVLGIGDPEQMAKMPFTQTGFRLRPPEDVATLALEAGFARVDNRHTDTGRRVFHLLVCEKPG